MTNGSRERLLEAALDLLDEQGVDALTLRAIARRAGVSHSAPLKHFPHRAALLSAVATQGFHEIDEWAGEAIRALPPDASPARRLRTSTRAYVEYAVARPEMFALMFRRDLLDPDDRELRRAAFGSFDHLIHLVQARQAEGWQADAEPRLLTGALWSAMHGLAQLWTWGTLPLATGARSIEDALDGLCGAFGIGAGNGRKDDT